MNAALRFSRVVLIIMQGLSPASPPLVETAGCTVLAIHCMNGLGTAERSASARML